MFFMRIQPNFLAVLNVSLFTATFLFGIAACNNQQDVTEADKSKDIAEVQNDTRFTDSAKASDATFMEDVALANMHEIAIGQLGKDRSKSPEVLMLSKMLIDDHTTALDNLKVLADKKNITLPISTENNKDEAINKLVKQKTATFDKAFIDLNVQLHKEAIAKFMAADSTTGDADIKSYIADVLPNLKKHLEHAEQIQKGSK